MKLNKKKKIRIVLAAVAVLAILLASFRFLKNYAVQSMRLAELRMEAREAFAAEDWKKAEKLLNQYLGQDHDSEEDYVRLAQVYRHFGNTEEEMRCWYRAWTLNPLKHEYWNTYTACAVNARYFPHLYSALNRRLHLHEQLTPKDKMLYLISAVMADHPKEAEEYHELMLKEYPEAFRRDELSRFADFLATYKKHTLEELPKFFEQGIQSDDPIVRLESILLYLANIELFDEDADSIFKQKETLLREAVALNRFAATPLLANFYFSRLRFNSVFEIAEPYLADIPHIPLSVLYAESCVYGAQPEKLKPLAEQFRLLGPKYRLLASYFDALYDFSQGAEHNDDLIIRMQEVGAVVQSDLVNLINLQIALNSDSIEKVSNSLEIIMRSRPFFDIQERARSAVRHYVGSKVGEDPSLAEDPRIARLAQLIWDPEEGDLFLARIIVSDLYRRKVLTRQTVQNVTGAFPSDPYLLQVAADFELRNGNPEQSLQYIERFYALKEKDPSRENEFAFMHMAALERMGRIDEAAKEYLAIVDKSGMDRAVLYDYFRFCIEHERRTELSEMAERLNGSNEPDLKSLVPFFRAEDLFLQGKQDEALALLETSETDQPDFALHAANRLSNYDWLDQALSRYFALLNKYPNKQLVLANIAEVYIAKEMKSEALSYAERSWESNQDTSFGQFVYAKMLAANEQYQNAEKILKMPYREIQLTDVVKNLWTDIMLHCVQEDLANRYFMRALERSSHYLLLYPEDYTFREFKLRSEKETRTMIRPSVKPASGNARAGDAANAAEDAGDGDAPSADDDASDSD